MTDKEKPADDSFGGAMPAAAQELPTTVVNSLTASGAPVKPDSPNMVFGVPPADE